MATASDDPRTEAQKAAFKPVEKFDTGIAKDTIGITDAVPALTDPVALAAGIGVGVSSSVIPYVCDQLAMARLPRATYALMVSLLPATATVVGIVVLTQIPTPAEAIGVALVVVGVAAHRDRDSALSRS